MICNNGVSFLENYCSQCGGKIFIDTYNRCKCGNIIFAKDKFCGKCGKNISDITGKINMFNRIKRLLGV